MSSVHTIIIIIILFYFIDRSLPVSVGDLLHNFAVETDFPNVLNEKASRTAKHCMRFIISLSASRYERNLNLTE